MSYNSTGIEKFCGILQIVALCYFVLILGQAFCAAEPAVLVDIDRFIQTTQFEAISIARDLYWAFLRF